MTWVDLLGYLASATVFATFCTTTMVRLRMVAIASNVLFIAYGISDHIFPVALLHCTLLPINVAQLIAIRRRVRDIHGVGAADIEIEGLLPYLKPTPGTRAGDVLMARDAPADRMFFLADGAVEVVEAGKRLGRGAVLGEIGLFAPHGKRTATVRCLSDCRLYELDAAKVKELCLKDREFGVALLRLALGRLSENTARAPRA